MHSPETVAFDIKYPWKSKDEYSENFITIWHNDPEKDGTDDSCGWFLRPRHLDKDILKKIINDYEFDWDSMYEKYNTGLFLPNGQPHFSVSGVTLSLFYKAALQIFKAKQKDKYQKKAMKYIQNNLARLLIFAENPVDSLFDSVTRKFEEGCNEEYTTEKRNERIRSMAGIIYAYIMRDLRPWYKHPRWHIHHWSIQIHPLQKLTRFLFTKCCHCKKRFGWNESTHGSWGGKQVWHSGCDTSSKPKEA